MTNSHIPTSEQRNGHAPRGVLVRRDEMADLGDPVSATAVPSRLERWRQRLPEIISEPQPSISDLYRDATTPNPGETEVPAWRAIWAYLVAIPVKALGMAAGWVAEHPARTGVTAVLALLVGTALAQSELAGIVPSFLNITDWF